MSLHNSLSIVRGILQPHSVLHLCCEDLVFVVMIGIRSTVGLPWGLELILATGGPRLDADPGSRYPGSTDFEL